MGRNSFSDWKAEVVLPTFFVEFCVFLGSESQMYTSLVWIWITFLNWAAFTSSVVQGHPQAHYQWFHFFISTVMPSLVDVHFVNKFMWCHADFLQALTNFILCIMIKTKKSRKVKIRTEMHNDHGSFDHAGITHNSYSCSRHAFGHSHSVHLQYMFVNNRFMFSTQDEHNLCLNIEFMIYFLFFWCVWVGGRQGLVFKVS